MPLKLPHPCQPIHRLQMVVPHPYPVIKSLQCEVEVLLRLQLDHREPAIRRHTQ